MATNAQLKALTAEQIANQTAENSVTRTNIKGRIDAAYDYTDQRAEELAASKQDKLFSGTNIKTLNGEAILGFGNISIPGSGVAAAWGNITGSISAQADLQSELSSKLPKEAGKGLSTNDYTNADKNKLSSLTVPVITDISQQIPFNNVCTAMSGSLNADTNFTRFLAGSKPSYGTILRLDTNGFAVTFTGFRKDTGSESISNTDLNIIYFWYDGVEYAYTIKRYAQVIAWDSLVFRTLTGDVSKTGNVYTFTSGGDGKAYNPSKRLPVGAKAGVRYSIVDDFVCGLHDSNAYPGNAVYFKYYFFLDLNASLIGIRESAGPMTAVAKPTGATNWALFVDAFGTVTAEYSTDSGDTWNLIYTYTTPSTTPLYFQFQAGQYQTRILTNPEILNGQAF